nr:IclR family transcriptional regulator [Propionibacterium sp.]
MPRLTPALMRALDILELFLDPERRLDAADVSRCTGLPRTTAHELVTTLITRGYLQREEGSLLRLGPKLLALGDAYSARYDLLGEATAVAKDLCAETGETASVALLEGAEVFYIAKAEPHDSLPTLSRIGQRLPAHCTALGKVLLADLAPEEVARRYPAGGRLPTLTPRSLSTLEALLAELDVVRARGVAYEIEESGPNTHCVAAAVQNSLGRAVAAVSLAVPISRWELRQQHEWDELIRGAAARLSAQYGYAA